MSTGVNIKPRARDSARTRYAILQSALRAFSTQSYDAVGLRGVAEDAGVTAMLVGRYFGSKEALFVEVVEEAFGGAPLAGSAADLARHVVQKTSANTEDAMLIVLSSASHPKAAVVLREAIERRFEGPLADTLSGRERSERAAFLLSTLAGFQLMRQVLGVTTLAKADEKRLVKRLTALFETALAP